MIIDILTLFPDMFTPLKESVIGRAVKAEKVEIRVTDIRDYTLDKHKKCDDYTFGGGAGMVLMPQPVASAIEAIDPEHKARRIYMSPKGKTFTQKMVPELLLSERLLLLCGHYEGVDQRVIDLYIDEEISIGDAVCRYIDGVLSNDSLTDETFTGDTLEYPQYTRPREFMGLTVPEVLLSGNHAEIDKWRKKESLALTKKMRPDLIKKGENE